MMEESVEVKLFPSSRLIVYRNGETSLGSVTAETVSDDQPKETYGKILGVVFSPIPYQVGDSASASPERGVEVLPVKRLLKLLEAVSFGPVKRAISFLDTSKSNTHLLKLQGGISLKRKDSKLTFGKGIQCSATGPPLVWPGTALVQPGTKNWSGPKPISIIGSTGSIGTQTLEIVSENPDKFKVVALVKLVLDGGFVEADTIVSVGGFDAPEVNAFGHTFRDYDAESERKKQLEEFYRMNHINQTYDFVKKMRDEFKKLDKLEMSIWECCELLNEVVDESDPDLDEPQIEHLLQTAEAIRKDYPNEDWLHLTALIHDLGKVLLLPRFGELPQWAVVGDTHPLGCAFDESIVHHKYCKDNADINNPVYQTKNGIYTEGCGLENVMISWGHDDYMYLVAKENGSTLPQAGLFIIRYHSLYREIITEC